MESPNYKSITVEQLLFGSRVIRTLPRCNLRPLKNKLPVDLKIQAAESRSPFPCTQMTLPTKEK